MTTKDRGLGSPNIDPNKKHEIQSKGGKASGGNFKNDRERAREAGRKGGLAGGDKKKNEALKVLVG